MPIELFETGEKRAWALWRIEETENDLQDLLLVNESVPDSISNQPKRLEWLAGRLLTQTLLDNFGLKYGGIRKDDYGKPYIENAQVHLSLTHSYPYAGVVVDVQHPVGIDLEQPKEKLLRIGPRVLSAAELADAGSDVTKHCVYWCAKETLIKIYGKKDLSLATQLKIEPFTLHQEGDIIGRILVNDSERIIPLYYRVFKRFVVVFNSEE